MHIILDYIWTMVKKELKKRILVVDEAWYLMQYDDSAAFLRGIIKRGRKYYLGVTTITQDVDDFLNTPYGKEIVTNSSIQILLKQHSAAIDLIGETFYLSEGEKQLLLSADKGEGIFFAGQNHVAIQVIASEEEHKLITSNPEEILRQKIAEKQASLAKKEEESLKPKEEKEEKTEEIQNPPPAPAGTSLEEGRLKEEGLKPKEEIEEKTEEIKPQILFKPEVEESPEEALLKKVTQMEEEENKKAEEELKKVNSEKNVEENNNKSGSLPKYQELFKSAPPLPPLPKFEAPTKPLFINQQKEPVIPQPPQLAKKTKAEFVDKKEETSQNPSQPAAVSPLDKGDGKKDEAKMTYDKLFGNDSES